MTKRRLFAAALAVAMAVAIPYAYAAGLFPGFPIVGSASYSNGIVTIPAGPTAVTGSELVPADTVLSGGQAPQTVLLPMAALNALPWAYETHPTTASTTIMSNNVGGLFISSTTGAAKANMTVQFPSSPIDNQRLTVATNVSLTQLFFSPNSGQSIGANNDCRVVGTGCVLSPTLATTTAGLASMMWVFRLSNTTWFRIQ